MNLAILIMMLTALPVLYYYYCLYQVNEKTKYLIGLLAGLWAFIGVLLVYKGIIGFSYFIIYIVLTIIVYIYDLVMGRVEEYEEEDEEEYGEYEVEWPIDVSNVMMGISVLIVVLLMYFAFFLTSVSPARVDDPTGFDEKGETYKRLPNAYKYEYKSALHRAYVVVITVRSIPFTTGFYESALDRARPYIEDYIKEEYNQDATLELRDEDTVEIDGHDAAQQTYDVYWRTVMGQKSAVMVLQAFFYHEDFETIIIGYVYPPEGKDATLGLVGKIEC